MIRRRKRTVIGGVFGTLALALTPVLAGGSAQAADGTFSIDFGTTSSVPVSGYLRDAGEAFSVERGSGWQDESGVALAIVGNGRQRNKLADKRLDTFMSMQLVAGSVGVATPARYELAVPSGSYTLIVGVGDASYIDSRHVIRAEGSPFLDFTPSSGTRTRIVTSPIRVSDGRLTLDAVGGTNTKIGFLDLVPAPTASPTEPPAPTDPPAAIRLNAAGPAVTTGGAEWSADQHFVGGAASSNVRAASIAGTTDDVLYTTARVSGVRLGGFRYDIPVAAGTYDVRLHFAEIWFGAPGGGAAGAGKRVFSANLEGGTVELVNFDIYASVGPTTATIRSFRSAVNDGSLTIDFTAKVDQPLISAIEIVRADGPPDTTPPTVSMSLAGSEDSSGAYLGGPTITINAADSGSGISQVSYSIDNGPSQFYANPFVVRAGGTHTVVATATDAAGNPATPVSSTFTVVAQSATAWPATWAYASPSPVPCFEATIATVGSKVYRFGGFKNSAFQVDRTYSSYDPAANVWASLGTLPLGMAESHLAVAHDDRYIYLAGGFGGDLDHTKNPTQWISDWVMRFDTVENAWTRLATLPQARGAGIFALVDRELHYITGNPADRVTNAADHFVLNLDTNLWSTAAPMPDPKDHLSGVVLGGLIYALGGEHGHDVLSEQSATAHVYNPATNGWKRLADLPVAKSHTEGGTFVSDNKIIMAGGQVADFAPTNQVASYEPSSNTWAELAPLPAARQGAMVQRVGNKIAFGIGGIRPSQPQTKVWLGTLP